MGDADMCLQGIVEGVKVGMGGGRGIMWPRASLCVGVAIGFGFGSEGGSETSQGWTRCRTVVVQREGEKEREVRCRWREQGHSFSNSGRVLAVSSKWLQEACSTHCCYWCRCGLQSCTSYLGRCLDTPRPEVVQTSGCKIYSRPEPSCSFMPHAVYTDLGIACLCRTCTCVPVDFVCYLGRWCHQPAKCLRQGFFLPPFGTSLPRGESQTSEFTSRNHEERGNFNRGQKRPPPN